MTKYADELADMHPRSWLSKYRKTSPFYLLKMGIFYVLLGNALAVAVSLVLPYLIAGYKEPNISLPILSGVFAGPSEETLFYGIPFYLSGNPYVVLLTGIAWSSLHILNTTVFHINGLAYANYLGTIPWIFFTLRVWISGKGWFSIIFHSAYDVIVLSGSCAVGQNTCNLTEGPYSSIIIAVEAISSAVLLVITYALYKRRKKISERSIKSARDTYAMPVKRDIIKPKRPLVISVLGVTYVIVAILLTLLNELFKSKFSFEFFGNLVVVQIIMAVVLLSGKGGRTVPLIIALIDTAALGGISMISHGTRLPIVSIGLDVVTVFTLMRQDVSNYFKQVAVWKAGA